MNNYVHTFSYTSPCTYTFLWVLLHNSFYKTNPIHIYKKSIPKSHIRTSKNFFPRKKKTEPNHLSHIKPHKPLVLRENTRAAVKKWNTPPSSWFPPREKKRNFPDRYTGAAVCKQSARRGRSQHTVAPRILCKYSFTYSVWASLCSNMRSDTN